MAPVTAAGFLVAILLGSSTAFVPSGRSSSWRPKPPQSPHLSAITRPATPAVRQMTVGKAADDAAQRAAALREAAAAMRAQATELEEKQAQERREHAQRSFNIFSSDPDNDRAVGVAELRAGLEGPLKKTFTKQLATRMGRKPTQEEVDAKISELPGGVLFPDDLAKRLIKMYDQNGDGVLQKSEFAPTEELRARLESIFRERREEELEARRVERQRERDTKLRGEGRGLPEVGGSDREAASATTLEKAMCAVPYILPLSDGVVYAQHLYSTFPQQMAWSEPLATLLVAVNNLPFATLVAFFGMSILSSNPNINKLLRFNMLQAINFDIALIVPSVFGPLLTWSLGSDAYKIAPLTDIASDILAISLVLAVAYSIAASATGAIPNKIPFFGKVNRVTRDDN